MELKTIQKELLIKATRKSISYILTDLRLINNCQFSKGEKELLHSLALEIYEKDITIIINDHAYYPYVTGYDGTYIIAGIKITNIISGD